MSRKASQNVVEDDGWRVELKENSFGYVLQHDLEGLTLLLHRGNYGWQPVPDHEVMMPHQVYARKVEDLIAGANSCREIVLVDVENALWQTVWVKSAWEVSFPEPSRKNVKDEGPDKEDLRRAIRKVYEHGYARGGDHEARGVWFPKRVAREYVDSEPYPVQEILEGCNP